ncbi:WbqC family protein [Rhodoferax ferrireducens]|uniref:WbqC family protein n=1 Tax=Rhodoferax ferrireducens TaxID=192843 RepID=UPI000E0DB26A|nr:WbqC family protein [Rhodoferax ferrireducens]
MKTVVVLQSNYIPWKGYFDLIHDADVFIFYDDLQFTKNDWRNRNKIKTAQGSKWLSIPVGTSANRLICEVAMEDARWQRSHWDSLRQQYGKCPYFKLYQPFFEEVYLDRRWTNLSGLNQHLIRYISHDILKITTQFRDSREFELEGQKLDRLLDLVVRSNATRYVSGPAAKDYIKSERFGELGIELVWKDYSNYPEYPQPYPPFGHGVSILDLLFNVGPEAPHYIWGWRDEKVSS